MRVGGALCRKARCAGLVPCRQWWPTNEMLIKPRGGVWVLLRTKLGPPRLMVINMTGFTYWKYADYDRIMVALGVVLVIFFQEGPQRVLENEKNVWNMKLEYYAL